MSATITEIEQPPSSASTSGRWVVAGMFGFAVLMTGLLWTYWELHTRPFRELQYAIAREFPGSSPRVEGGAHKSHLDSPTRLRFVMRVDFDPNSNDSRVLKIMNRVFELAETHNNPRDYDELEFHLFLKRAEATPRVRTVETQPDQFPLTNGSLDQ